MGRGTKHRCDWNPTTLQTAIDAMKLYRHTCKIMSNRKVFRPEDDFMDATLRRIHEDALSVYLDIWSANSINASKNPSMAETRMCLQRSAILKCRELLALMELAKSQFHLASGKFWNWAGMAVDLGKSVSAWHRTDMRRFSGNPKQNESYPERGKAARG